MNGDQPSATGRPGGYGLDVERVIDAPAELTAEQLFPPHSIASVGTVPLMVPF